MSLNCNEGDLAIVVRSDSGNEGKIVQCLELVITDRAPDTTGQMRVFHGGVQALWRTDKPLNAIHNISGVNRQMMYCRDSQLKPLRGDITSDSAHEQKEISNG